MQFTSNSTFWLHAHIICVICKTHLTSPKHKITAVPIASRDLVLVTEEQRSILTGKSFRQPHHAKGTFFIWMRRRHRLWPSSVFQDKSPCPVPKSCHDNIAHALCLYITLFTPKAPFKVRITRCISSDSLLRFNLCSIIDFWLELDLQITHCWT